MTGYEDGRAELNQAIDQAQQKGYVAKVFVSYSWAAEEVTPIVSELQQVFDKNQIEFVRDTNALKPGDSIAEFMQRLARADKIITVVSECYFKSENCMNELLQISKRGDMAERTKAIIVEGFKPYDLDVQIDLVAFWDNKAKEASKKIESLPREKTLLLQKRVNLYHEISSNINELTDFVADRLVIPLAELRKQNYQPILDALFPVKPAELITDKQKDKVPETEANLDEDTIDSEQEIIEKEQQFLKDISLTISTTLNNCQIFKEQLMQVLNLTTDELIPFLLANCSPADFKNLVQQFEVAIEQAVKNLPKDDFIKKQEFANAVEKFFNCWLIYAVDADKVRKNPEIAYTLYSICHELQHAFTGRRVPDVQKPSTFQYANKLNKLETGFNLDQEVLETLLQLSNRIWSERTVDYYQKLSPTGDLEITIIASKIADWLNHYKTHPGLSFRKSICFLSDMSTDVAKYVQKEIKELIPELDFIVLQSDPKKQLFIVAENRLDMAVEAFFDTLKNYLKP